MEKSTESLRLQEECVEAKELVVRGVRGDLEATKGAIEGFWALSQNRRRRTAYHESTIALEHLELEEWRRMGRLDTDMPHIMQNAAYLLCDMLGRDMNWKNIQYLTSNADRNKEYH